MNLEASTLQGCGPVAEQNKSRLHPGTINNCSDTEIHGQLLVVLKSVTFMGHFFLIQHY
jgi:hypothetical protein